MRTDGIHHLEDIRQRCSIDPDTGCWVWKGNMNSSGVPSVNLRAGVIGASNVVTSARRAAWLLSGRRAGPKQAVYRAACCNEPRCVNPQHAGVGSMGSQTVASAVRDPAAFRHPAKLAGLVRCHIERAVAPERVAAIERSLEAGQTLEQAAQAHGVHVHTARSIARRQHVHQRKGLRRGASVFAWAAMS